MKFDNNPRNPDPMPVPDDGDEYQPYSELVAAATVFAHQSAHGGPHVLNIVVDAPAGVTVRVHVNDGIAYDGCVSS